MYYVRHVLKEHGNALIEMLRGQLYMTPDAIKIALAKLRSGEGKIIRGTYTDRNKPSILTEIPVNGYTLYAEEPMSGLNNSVEMEGRTMYMMPTSTRALKQQKAYSIPQRRGAASSANSVDGQSRIVKGFLQDANGKEAKTGHRGRFFFPAWEPNARR